jgi:hypothetical protein
MLRLGIAINRTQKRIVTGTNFDPTAQAFITAAGITDPNQRNAINDLTIGLKLSNIFSKIPCLYPMVGPNATAHTYNLIDVATFQLTFLGGWTFTNGAKPNGVNAYATSNFKPFTNYATTTSRGHGLYTNTNNIAAQYSLGVYESAANAYYGMNHSGSFALTGDIAANASYIATNSIGYAVTQKFSNTDNKSYKNGVQVGSSTTNNNKDTNFQYYLGAMNGDNTAQIFSANNIVTAHLQNNLTAGDIATLYTLIFNYNSSLSRQ